LIVPYYAMEIKRYLRNFDWLILGCVVGLLVIGEVFIWSASYHSLENYRGYYEPYAKRQVAWIIVSFAVFFILLVPSYRRAAGLAYVIYGAGLFLLVYVILFGQAAYESRRWISIYRFSFQPSEFMKIIFIIVLARYLMYRKNYRTFKGLLIPFVMTLVPMGLIIIEPDLGTAMILMVVFFGLLYVAGARVKHLLSIIGLGICSIPMFYYFMLKDYQKMRLASFALSWFGDEKPAWLVSLLGLGSQIEGHALRGGYQLNQSLIAVGSGGLFGKGWGLGTQNRLNFLPAHHNDFIFAVIGEEWGLVGCIIVIALYALIIMCGLGIAARTREPFGRLIAVGVVLLFVSQVVINIGMTVGMMPITGLPLPLVSYGGSSLLSSFMALALLMNVGIRRVPVLAAEDFA